MQVPEKPQYPQRFFGSFVTGVRRNLPLILILFVALLLRLIDLGDRSYFNDELSALYRTTPGTFADLLEHGVRPDFHPAGVQVFLYYYTQVAGTSPFWVRLPFALAGTTAVWLLFLLATRWFGRTTGWMSASALAFLGFPLLYSQLARPYSTGMLFVLAAVIFWHNALFRPHSKAKHLYGNLAAMAVCFALAMYNHYFSFFMVGMIGITGLFWVSRRTFLPYLASGLMAMLLFLPHLDITIEQLSRGGLDTWLPPPGADWLLQHFKEMFNGGWSILVLSLLAGAAGFVLHRKAKNPYREPCSSGGKHKFVIIAVLWYFLPLFFAWWWSVNINPILQNSILLFAFPFLLMAIFYGFRNLYGMTARLVMGIYALILLAHLLLFSGYYQKDHYADFRSFSMRTCAIVDQQPQTVWATEVNHPWYFHFYPGKGCPATPPLFYHSLTLDLPALALQLDSIEATGMVYSTLRPSNPMIVSLIRQRFPVLQDYMISGHQAEWFYFTDGSTGTLSSSAYPMDTLCFFRFQPGSDPGSVYCEDEFLDIFDDEIPVVPQAGGALLHGAMVLEVAKAPEAIQWVFTTTRNGEQTSWNALAPDLLRQTNGSCFFTLRLPESFRKGDQIKVYLWNPGREQFIARKAELMLIYEPSYRNNHDLMNIRIKRK